MIVRRYCYCLSVAGPVLTLRFSLRQTPHRYNRMSNTSELLNGKPNRYQSHCDLHTQHCLTTVASMHEAPVEVSMSLCSCQHGALGRQADYRTEDCPADGGSLTMVQLNGADRSDAKNEVPA
jgi:hypothetical protein